MNDVPLVPVDISEWASFSGYLSQADHTVLDPFVFNILPKSLLPTGAYIVILAVGAWFLSELVWQQLHRISQNKDVRQGSKRGGEDDGLVLDSLKKKVS